MTQQPLDFSKQPITGSNFVKEFDLDRLKGQLRDIFDFMSSSAGRFTLREISDSTGFGEASISAQLRNLRKMGIDFDKARRGDPKQGLWEYWLIDGRQSA